jgi:hypothetical protein
VTVTDERPVDKSALDEAIAIGERAAKEAIDRSLEARRLRAAIANAIALANSGRVDGAIKLLKAVLTTSRND